MKYFYFAVLILALGFFTKCIKDPDSIKGPKNPIDTTIVLPIDTPVVDKDFYITATYNGKNWKAGYYKIWDYANITPAIPGVFMLEFGKPFGKWIDYGLECSPLSFKPGKQAIGSDFSNFNSPPSSIFVNMDLDNILGVYYIDTISRSNYLEITKLDTIKRIMEGTFEMYHNRYVDTTSGIPPHPLPDTANFRDGRFRIKWE